MLTQCQEISRPYEASRFRKKTDKPQYNYPCPWKYEHGVHGGIIHGRVTTTVL